jgi:hypothetical protein
MLSVSAATATAFEATARAVAPHQRLGLNAVHLEASCHRFLPIIVAMDGGLRAFARAGSPQKYESHKESPLLTPLPARMLLD